MEKNVRKFQGGIFLTHTVLLLLFFSYGGCVYVHGQNYCTENLGMV